MEDEIAARGGAYRKRQSCPNEEALGVEFSVDLKANGSLPQRIIEGIMRLQRMLNARRGGYGGDTDVRTLGRDIRSAVDFDDKLVGDDGEVGDALNAGKRGDGKGTTRAQDRPQEYALHGSRG